MVCSVMIRGGPPCGIALLLSNLFPQCRWCPMLVMGLWSPRMSNWQMDYGIFAAHCLPATFDGDRRCGRKPCCFTSRSRAWLTWAPLSTSSQVFKQGLLQASCFWSYHRVRKPMLDHEKSRQAFLLAIFASAWSSLSPDCLTV